MTSSSQRPLILVTNDDGVTSKGIRSLVQAVMPLGDVVVVAPDKPQSGMGHAVTISGILRFSEVTFPEKVQAYSCTGTPVDCVKMAIYRVLHRKPDLVVSGINHGANSSINVIYSGTMSAAVEGAVEGIPSVGFSLLSNDENADFDASIHFAQKVCKEILQNGMPEGVCLNVNIPKGKLEDIKGVKICRQAKAYWEDTFDHRKDPAGNDYFWLKGEFKNFDHGEDTDEWALKHNFVSIVPVHYDLTAYHVLSNLQQWNLQ